MESRSFDLLHTTNTTMIGDIGECLAWYYLFHEGITPYGWGSVLIGQGLDWRSHCNWLTKKQKNYLDDWRQRGKIWAWDFIGLGSWHHNQKVYLVEVKTSRPGKPKHGLKSSSTISQKDFERAKQLGFHLLLLNVELADNWECVVTPRELLAGTG